MAERAPLSLNALTSPELKRKEWLRFFLIKHYYVKTKAGDSFGFGLRFAAAFSQLEFGVCMFHLSFCVIWMCKGTSWGRLKSSGEKSKGGTQ